MAAEPGCNEEALVAKSLELFMGEMSVPLQLLQQKNSEHVGIQHKVAEAEVSNLEVEEETEQMKIYREKEKKKETRRLAQKKATRLAILTGLPSLINTKTGIMGCTIAKYKEQSVAVISLPIVECLFEAQVEGLWENVTECDVRRFFGREPGSVPDKVLSEVEVDFKGVDFFNMILQTPLRAAHPYQEKRNKNRFFFATAESWKKMLDLALAQVSPSMVEFSIPRSLESRRSAVKRLKRANLPVELVEFFKIPVELVGKVHVVNSVMEET